MGVKSVLWLTEKLKESHRHGEDMTSLKTQNVVYFWCADLCCSLNRCIVLFLISNLQVASLPTLQTLPVCWAWRRDLWSSSLWKNLKNSLTLSKTSFLPLHLIFWSLILFCALLYLIKFFGYIKALSNIFFTSKGNLMTMALMKINTPLYSWSFQFIGLFSQTDTTKAKPVDTKP